MYAHRSCPERATRLVRAGARRRVDTLSTRAIDEGACRRCCCRVRRDSSRPPASTDANDTLRMDSSRCGILDVPAAAPRGQNGAGRRCVRPNPPGSGGALVSAGQRAARPAAASPASGRRRAPGSPARGADRPPVAPAIPGRAAARRGSPGGAPATPPAGTAPPSGAPATPPAGVTPGTPAATPDAPPAAVAPSAVAAPGAPAESASPAGAAQSSAAPPAAIAAAPSPAGAAAAPSADEPPFQVAIGRLALSPLVLMQVQAIPYVGRTPSSRRATSPRGGFRFRRARFGFEGRLRRACRSRSPPSSPETRTARRSSTRPGSATPLFKLPLSARTTCPSRRSAITGPATARSSSGPSRCGRWRPSTSSGSTRGPPLDGRAQLLRRRLQRPPALRPVLRRLIENAAMLGNRFDGLAYVARLASEPLGPLARTVEDLAARRPPRRRRRELLLQRRRHARHPRHRRRRPGPRSRACTSSASSSPTRATPRHPTQPSASSPRSVDRGRRRGGLRLVRRISSGSRAVRVARSQHRRQGRDGQLDPHRRRELPRPPQHPQGAGRLHPPAGAPRRLAEERRLAFQLQLNL